ncbi:hypothetical protein C7974DRAFT_417591 [Boeremia exigua]|uniref:uncharacterized protein n=1 Tax=Boeremia exigua TaxID=749465 RepID=UPI001E8EEF9F|nr:uncharacterized protein C7974DRAFT_417591 [Boeremia exigua]KAH6613840.1 hypothetical protein C7974DRAFT_417591 [Boeremia exigua]
MTWHVIDKGYWTEPLDFAIPVTSGGQFFKYFHQHISPLHFTTSGGHFGKYSKLPVELQLRIIQLCDAQTLFQLMHTSHDLRTESKKLFFADQKTWYRLHADLLRNCSSPSELVHDAYFLASIEQLNLEFELSFNSWYPEDWWETGATDEELIEIFDERINAGINDFWQTVQRVCPRVKRIMLSTDDGRLHGSPPMTDCCHRVAQLCPDGISLFFYAAEIGDDLSNCRRKRLLWRLTAGQGGKDTVITPKLERPSLPGTIVVPPKKPYEGRVGAFIKANSLWEKFNDQRRAAELHRAAAIEKHYFEGRHEPFSCLVTNCDAWFEQPEQYTTHLLTTGHGAHEAAPNTIDALCTQNTKRIEELRQEHNEAHQYFWDWWGEYGTQQRSMAESEVMGQLEHDALYTQSKVVTEHRIFLSIHEAKMWLSYE